MPIANRELKSGTVLVARYKGKDHRANVVKTKDGLRLKLADGREFKSPSSAGVAVKGPGKTCDGWEFWSVEGAAAVPVRAKRQNSATAPTAPKAKRTAKAAPKLKGKPRAAPKAKKGATQRKAKTVAKKASRKASAKKAEPKPAKATAIGCGECAETFPTSREAADHMREAHGSVEAAGTGSR